MQTQSKQKAVPAAVRKACNAISEAYVALFVAKHEYDVERRDIAGEVFAAIKALRAESETPLAYLRHVETLFGNGVKGKAHVRGMVADDLSERGCLDGTVRVQMHYARSVAWYMANNEPAETFRATYNKANPPKGGKSASVASKPDDSAKKPGTVTVVTAETGRAWVESNILDALDVIERALVARKATIDAGGIHAIRERLIEAAKAAKAANS
jgi:hypothetical protein